MRPRKVPPKRLSRLGPTALVTGASDGIGRATALALAAAGFDLILSARRAERLGELAGQIRQEHGVAVSLVPADLSHPEGLAALHTVIVEQDPGVAVLAAGFGAAGPLAEADLESELDMVDVNVRAVLALCHCLAGQMTRRGAGQLVLLGSLVGFQGNGISANYSATKAYVQSLAEGLAVELAPAGVHVLSVAPGPVNSGFAARAGMTMGQAGTPQAVAQGILASLGSSGTIRPGFLSKFLGYSLATAPRPLRVRIMSKIMAGMAGPRVEGVPRHRQA